MVGLDEMGHYARSVELSNGNLLSLQDGNPALAGGKISNTQYEFIEKAKQVQSGNSTKYKATDKDWYHKFSSLPYTNQKRFYVNTNTVAPIHLFLTYHMFLQLICQKLLE